VTSTSSGCRTLPFESFGGAHFQLSGRASIAPILVYPSFLVFLCFVPMMRTSFPYNPANFIAIPGAHTRHRVVSSKQAWWIMTALSLAWHALTKSGNKFLIFAARAASRCCSSSLVMIGIPRYFSSSALDDLNAFLCSCL